MNLARLSEQCVQNFGEYDSLVFEGRAFTNRELLEESRRLASGLAALGLRPGDKVVVMMRNAPEVLVSYPAIWQAGLVVIPVLFLLETRELAYILQNSEARAVITSGDFVDKVRAATRDAPTVEHVVVVGEPRDVPRSIAYRDLVDHGEPSTAVVDRAADDLAVVLYTSGTTGQPKGVMQTHGNLLAAATNSLSSSQPHDDEVSLLVLPLAHSFGLGVSVGANLRKRRAVLMPWFDPERALALIQEHRVTAMAGVPTMFVYMLHHPRADEYDTSSVERWLVGAAPMPTEQLARFERKFGGTMYVGYGLTEACPGIAVEREGMARKPGSTGIALEGVRVAIVDDEGRPLPAGEIGEIIAAGSNISPGYYRMPDATRETFRDGWLYTGDIGKLDDDGYLYILERKKDLIIRGGFNVYPKDVEEILHAHEAVLEAAVVGVPDALKGEEVCACIVLKPGQRLDARTLIEHCQANLAKYKTPTFVEFLDAMPKTNIGKIQKRALRARCAEKYGR